MPTKRYAAIFVVIGGGGCIATNRDERIVDRDHCAVHRGCGAVDGQVTRDGQVAAYRAIVDSRYTVSANIAGFRDPESFSATSVVNVERGGTAN